ncbi:MAG: hypothetical protein COA47_03055 [Robiginitomaculum sp.]|nr:MAG: hypothetical protein COA47_03055 [Robiginitomaculum sp.]
MKQLDFLHVASFNGNVGDNANHNGSLRLLMQNLGAQLQVKQLEIRKSYNNYTLEDGWSFDEKFADEVNAHDLTFVGGGNYFELWLSGSQTGTTIDISMAVLEKIKSPTVFYGLGCDIAMGVEQEAIDKFERFLDYLDKRQNFMVFLRNDGSQQTLRDLYGTKFDHFVRCVPDGGFFVDATQKSDPDFIVPGKKNIVVNLSGDMMDTRFPDSSNMSYADFISQIGIVLETLIDRQNANIIFIPHMYKDISCIYDCMENINDFKNRYNVRVAPLLTGVGSENTIFSLYKHADLAMGMRFHANVCPVGLNTPAIGLSSYKQVKELYRELELESSCIEVNKGNFKDTLIELATEYLTAPLDIKRKLKRQKTKLSAWIIREHKKIDEILLG